MNSPYQYQVQLPANVEVGKRYPVLFALHGIGYVSPEKEERGLGAIDSVVLQEGADTYQQLGLVKNKLDMSKVVSEELMEDEEK